MFCVRTGTGADRSWFSIVSLNRQGEAEKTDLKMSDFAVFDL